MTSSPYSGKPEPSWLAITQQLINNHPLKPQVILEATLTAWATLWQTTVGTGPLAVKLADLRIPATVVGYFFEVLLARELEQRDPLWRGSQSKEEKDLVYLRDPALSIEIKTSGQAGFKVYGNRSYGQKAASDLLVKKEKSGFYITVNFFGPVLTLIRFGWIDAADRDPQEAPTGQMAGLRQAVYDYKLIPISGSYRQQAPVLLLDGVGPAIKAQFAELAIHTVGDLLHYQGQLPSRLARIVQKNRTFLDGCIDVPTPSAEQP
ncbi:MAG: ScaI family restriction endonuclease [Gemmataceae bacterium]